MKIRSLGEREIPALSEFLIDQFHSEFSESLPPVNREKVIRTVYSTWKNGRVLVVDDGEIKGSLGLFRTGPWYSDAEHYQDQWFFVSKDKRNFKVSAALLKAAQIVAEKDGLPLRVAASVGGRVHVMDRLFRRAGFKRIGGLYEEQK